MSQRVDAIVIGASPAGLVAATHLAKAGRRVALVEETLRTEGVRLLSLPVAKDALGGVPHDESLMRRMTQLRLVSTRGRDWASMDFGSSNAEAADLVSVEMDDFLMNLGHAADGAGVRRRSGFKELLLEEHRVRGVATSDGEDLLAPVTIIADGDDSEAAQQLSPLNEAMYSQQVLFAEQTWRYKEGVLNTRTGLPAHQGALTRISGELLGGLPAAFGWVYPGTNTMTIGLTVPRDIADERHIAPEKLLEGISRHPAFVQLLSGAEPGPRVLDVRERGGANRLRKLYGDGWLIAGDAAGLIDPRHRYELRIELTSGKAAAETTVYALDAGDATSTTLGLYRRMLLDSYVIAELKAADEELAQREKNPDLDGYYPELLVRRLALGLRAGLEPRQSERKQFATQTLTERPLWDIIKAGVGGFKLLG